jgi:hypothetical protein
MAHSARFAMALFSVPSGAIVHVPTAVSPADRALPPGEGTRSVWATELLRRRWRRAPAESSGAARLTRSRSVPFGHWAKPRIKAMAQSARFAIALSPTVRMGDKCKVIPIINNDKY